MIQGGGDAKRGWSSHPAQAERPFLLASLLFHLWCHERPTSFRHLTCRNFRVIPISFLHPADDETADYLFQCCSRVNLFFPGAFQLSVDSLPDLPDDTRIGVHDLTHAMNGGDTAEIAALIQAGEFEPETFPITRQGPPPLPAATTRGSVRQPGKVEKPFLLLMMLQSLSMAEYRGDVYDLIIRQLRSIPVRFDYRVDEETAEYLLRCCRRVNELFPGALNIGVGSILGRPDNFGVGNHSLTAAWGDPDWKMIEGLIDTGAFDFGTS